MDKSPFINIIVPAYNEESRIRTSVRALIRYLGESRFPYPYAITIVDNASTDRTPAYVAALAQEFPGVVTALTFPQKGKGGAIRRGWRERGDVMVFMDADLSSELSYLRPLVDAVIEGHGLAIGNRLGKHSEIIDRRIMRSTASRIYNSIVRLHFGSRIVDHQCGFKAIRKEVFECIDPLLRDTGWFFDTELLVIAQRLGYKIASIDIRWKDERQSKVSLFSTSYDMARAIYDFSRRLPHIPGAGGNASFFAQIARFLTSGGVAAAVNLGLFLFLYELMGVHYLTAVVETSIVVFFVSFTLQKVWTFEDPKVCTVPVQLPLYALSALCTVAANMVLIYVFVEWFELWPLVAQVLSLALIAIGNFFVYKFLIFHRRA